MDMDLQNIEDDLEDIVGAFDWSSLISAASEAANTGVQYKASQDASAAANKTSAIALSKATAADANWANAEQQLDLATQSKDQSRIVPAQALQSQALQAALAAGAGLSAVDQGKRVIAAQGAAQTAATAALNSPGDTAKQSLSRAWQKVLATAINPAAAGAMTGPGGKGGKAGGKGGAAGASWFTTVHGGLPGYAWLIGGAVTTTGLVLLLRALLHGGGHGHHRSYR